jgi:hypothetical protein
MFVRSTQVALPIFRDPHFLENESSLLSEPPTGTFCPEQKSPTERVRRAFPFWELGRMMLY